MIPLRGSTLQLGRKARAVPRDPGIRLRDPAAKGPNMLREQWLVLIGEQRIGWTECLIHKATEALDGQRWKGWTFQATAAVAGSRKEALEGQG